MMKMRICLFFLCFLLLLSCKGRFQDNTIINSKTIEKIEPYEIKELLNNYPETNYIGAYGTSEMKQMKSGSLRDFGIYHKSKIRITPTKQNENKIFVKGKLFIFNELKEKFNGEILITNIESRYIPYNTIDEKENRIKYDSILINDIKGKFHFILDNTEEYNGDIFISIENNNSKKWNIRNTGVELYGRYNNKGLVFGHITPSSSGIFRLTNENKFCINKNLLKFGWESYLYSNPNYFNCVFDSYTDEVESIQNSKEVIEQNRKIEFEEIK